MDLNKIFLWLDVDGTIIDSEALDDSFSSEIVERNVLGGKDEFWKIYESFRQSDGRVDLDQVIKFWARKHSLDRTKIIWAVKRLPFIKFIFQDFKKFAPKLGSFGDLGFFSNGAIWFQRQKAMKIKKFLNLKNREKNMLLSKNKRDMFPQMRGVSLGLFSVYVDDRLPILRAAIGEEAVDLGVLVYHRSEKPQITDKKILVIENFGQLMSKLSKVI